MESNDRTSQTWIQLAIFAPSDTLRQLFHMRMLLDLWRNHFRLEGGDLAILHDHGALRLPQADISSHKQISFASLNLRRFSGRRDEIALTCFRPQEIVDLMSLLRELEKRNHSKKPAKSMIDGQDTSSM